MAWISSPRPGTTTTTVVSGNFIGTDVTGTGAGPSTGSLNNQGVSVGAPGSTIYSTYGSSYAYLNGTSMASPHVAGLAGLIWASGKCSTATCVRGRIENNADKIALTGRSWSKGRINAYRSLTAIK